MPELASEPADQRSGQRPQAAVTRETIECCRVNLQCRLSVAVPQVVEYKSCRTGQLWPDVEDCKSSFHAVPAGRARNYFQGSIRQPKPLHCRRPRGKDPENKEGN